MNDIAEMVRTAADWIIDSATRHLTVRSLDPSGRYSWTPRCELRRGLITSAAGLSVGAKRMLNSGDGPVTNTFAVTAITKYIRMKVWNFGKGASPPRTMVESPRARWSSSVESWG